MLHYRGKDLADRPTHLQTHGHSTDGHHAGRDTHKDGTSKGIGQTQGHTACPFYRGEGDKDRRTDTHGQTLG